MFFVTPREKAVEKLNEGTLDLLIAGLTITPERQKVVDFSDPTLSNVSEVVVTGPSSPQLQPLTTWLVKKCLHGKPRAIGSIWKN